MWLLNYVMQTNKQIEESKRELVDKNEVKEKMRKYGFSAPDMTITEFVEDVLTTIGGVN